MVISEEVARKLYGNQSALGRIIRISNGWFEGGDHRRADVAHGRPGRQRPRAVDGDRIAVRNITVRHDIKAGTGDDFISVGSQAAVGATDTTWPNSGGTVDGIQAALVVDGGNSDGSQSGVDLLSVDDTGDLNDNTGVLTATTITGLDMATAGITYTLFEDLLIGLGSGNDTFTIDSTHAGAFRTTSLATWAGNDTVIVRTISGPTSIDTGTGDDTVRVSSTITGTGGALTGITAALTLTGSTGGNDRLFVDDAATTTDVIGVLTDLSLVGVGMTLGGSGALGNLVQVLSVLGAADGRFTIGIAGVGTTVQLDFDATAATVQQALEALLGAGNVVVAKAGGRWTVAYQGALSGAAGWAKAMMTVTSLGLITAASTPVTPALGTTHFPKQ